MQLNFDEGYHEVFIPQGKRVKNFASTKRYVYGPVVLKYHVYADGGVQGATENAVSVIMSEQYAPRNAIIVERLPKGEVLAALTEDVFKALLGATTSRWLGEQDVTPSERFHAKLLAEQLVTSEQAHGFNWS